MERLPKGLVSVSGNVTAELDGIGVDAVDVGDIIQLWKAYSTNPSAHEGDAGYRLQNFFWRIWGSKRLSTSLTGLTLARLFLQISEPTSSEPFDHGHGQSRTSKQVPAPAVKGSEPLSSSLKRSEKSPEHRHATDPSPDPATVPGPVTGPATAPAGPAHRSSSGTSSKPLQPILKKSNSSSHGETQKTTRLLLTGLGGQSVTRKPSNPPTPIPPSRPVALGEQLPQQQEKGSSARASQKKSFAVGSKAKASKRRPVLMRRKSSQQSSFSNSSTRNHSPEPNSPPVVNSGFDAAWLEDGIDEEAIEDSPEETHPILPKPRAASTPANANTNTNPAPNPTLTTQSETPQPPTDPSPPEPKTAKERIEALPLPQLPQTFLTDLKTLLHKSTPLPPLRPRASPPAVGFFSAQACRHYDVRHLSQENYEQPNRSVLVQENFRSRFVEQQRAAEEYYQRWWTQYQEQYREQYGRELDIERAQREGFGYGHGDPIEQGQEQGQAVPRLPNDTENELKNGEGKDERPDTATVTYETVSPSKSNSLSQTHSHIASTIATSILASSGPGNANGQLDLGMNPDLDLGLGQDMGLDSHGGFLPLGQAGHGLELGLSAGLGPDSVPGSGPLPGNGPGNGISGTTNGNSNSNMHASSSAMPVPVPTSGPTNPFTQTPGLSAPRGPSGLSLLISASRNSMGGGMAPPGVSTGAGTGTDTEGREGRRTDE